MGLFPVTWAVLAAALLAVEVGGRLGLFGLSPFGPTLSVVRSRPWGRTALVLFWMWVGWHVFAR